MAEEGYQKRDAKEMSENKLFSPVIVCSTEQIEELKKDPNWIERPDICLCPVFQPNKTQLEKIKKILDGADRYILTGDDWVKVK